MPVAAPAGFRLGAVRPDDAVAAFAQRKLLKPSFRWQEVWQAEHANGFAVAGVMRLNILQLFQDAVADAVTNGTDLRSFTEQLRTQLQGAGWWGQMEITDPRTGEVRKTRFDERRLKLIYDVNLRQSHAAGRWARGMRSRMPFIVYRTMGDERVRKSHQAWDWIVLPRDHPWWDTHIPPNGWLCRCHFYFTDQAGIDKLLAAGKTLKREAPETRWVEFLNKVTGQTERVPEGIDPGFAYNPGKLQLPRSIERLDRNLAAVGPTTPGAGDAHQVLRSVVTRSRSEPAFSDFLANPPRQDVGMPVAAVPALEREPAIASVSAQALRAQAAMPEFPRALPALAGQWALAQSVIDNGQRLQLDDGRVLWWWARGEGERRRVVVLDLQPSPLVWWVRQLVTLTVAEALRLYPLLAKVL